MVLSWQKKELFWRIVSGQIAQKQKQMTDSKENALKLYRCADFINSSIQAVGYHSFLHHLMTNIWHLWFPQSTTQDCPIFMWTTTTKKSSLNSASVTTLLETSLLNSSCWFSMMMMMTWQHMSWRSNGPLYEKND